VDAKGCANILYLRSMTPEKDHTQETFRAAELRQATEAAQRTPAERFHRLMKLIRIGKMLDRAKIVHQPSAPVSPDNMNVEVAKR